MSISPEYTNDQVPEFVYAYEAIPQGKKAAWFDDQPFTRNQFRVGRETIAEGAQSPPKPAELSPIS